MASSAPARAHDPADALRYNVTLTKRRCLAWDSTGHAEVVAEGASMLRQPGAALLVLFEELVRAAVAGHLQPHQVGSAVQALLAAPCDADAADPVSMFVELVNVLAEVDGYLPVLAPILHFSGISPARLRAELDLPVLMNVALVRPSFTRTGIRKATLALYRQSNYNLLREESEGYAKLITEFFTTITNSHPSSAVVHTTFEKVKAFIGAFDLDVGRVFDVTLDVFATVLVKYNRFFVKMLRASSWWPDQPALLGLDHGSLGVPSLPKWALPDHPVWYLRDDEKTEQMEQRQVRDVAFWQLVAKEGLKAYFHLGTHRRVPSDHTAFDPMEIDSGAGANTESKDGKEGANAGNEQSIWPKVWAAETGTLPPPSNFVAAQLLGFKLQYYGSKSRDERQALPDNLIYLAALLIKLGFISLVDLYPHLAPLDEDMPALQERLRKNKEEQEKKRRVAHTTNALANAPALSVAEKEIVPVRRTRPEKESASLAEPDHKTLTEAREAAEAAQAAKTEDQLKADEAVKAREAAKVEAAAKERATAKAQTVAKDKAEANKKSTDLGDQKTHLLRSLLSIGAIPEALFMIGRFPWLLELYTDIPDYIHRLLHYSLKHVYGETHTWCEQNGIATYEHVSIDHIPPIFSSEDSRKTLRWAQLERNDVGVGVDYRFYWDDWADNVPMCQTLDDVFLLCDSLVSLVGPAFGQDSGLLTKLARIGRRSMIEDRSAQNTQRWIQLCKTLLAPALSFSGGNPDVIKELYELLKMFDVEDRYSIYQEWFTGVSSRHASVQRVVSAIETETKGILRRISNDNAKKMARQLASLGYSCPGVVFKHALRHVQSYPNVMDALLESLQYFPELGYDCLNWAVIHILSGRSSESVQADGMMTRPWLTNLSKFTGKAYNRYANMSPIPVLRFMTNQLYTNSVTMVPLLQRMISLMSGIDKVDAMLTPAQILGLYGGGPGLRAYTLKHEAIDQRNFPMHRRMAARLARQLAESRLAPQMVAALAQPVGSYIYSGAMKDAPAKVIAVNLDNMFGVFIQYVEFLRNSLSVDEFNATVPDVVTLMSQFKIEPRFAFTIGRYSIAAAASAARKARTDDMLAQAERAKAAKEAQAASAGQPAASDARDGDVVMTDADGAPIVNGEAGEAKIASDAGPSGQGASQDASSSAQRDLSNPVVKALTARLQTEMPRKFGRHVCPLFYVTFWQLELGDVRVPMTEYTKAIEQLRPSWSSADHRRDVSVQAVRKREAERKALEEESTKLRLEVKQLVDDLQHFRGRLKEEREQWFSGVGMQDATAEGLHKAIMQDCFVPRVLLTPTDALFCVAMYRHMHSSGVPGFRTAKFLDVLFKQKLLVNVIFMCTPREIQSLGLFLNDILEELNGWHASKSAYNKQAFGANRDLPGFGRTFKPDRTPASFVEFKDFRPLLLKWHTHLYRALEETLSNKEHTQVRNALGLLSGLRDSFPAVEQYGKHLDELIQNIAQTETREDLRAASYSLLSQFRRNAKSWIPRETFAEVYQAPAALAPSEALTGAQTRAAGHAPSSSTARSDAAKPPTPAPSQQAPSQQAPKPQAQTQARVSQPSTQTKPLNATASTFASRGGPQ